MTPAELRRRADKTDAQAEAELEAGRPLEAAALFLKAEQDRTVAKEMERLAEGKGLPSPKRLASLKGMTPGQIDRRARAIAGAHANRKKDRFLQAIAKSQWRSMNRYARDRLDISPGMLTLYRQGKHPVSPAVAQRVLEDLGLPADKRTWPAGVAT